jgi:hypothetical protein
MNRRLLVFAGTIAATAALGGVAAAASAPTTVTGSATQVKPTTAVLNGTVNPNGASTTYYFQVGLTSSYGAATAPKSAGSGVKAKGISQSAGGFVQGTIYHYRLVSTNQFGMTFGRDRAFKTTGHAPPGVLTGSAVRLATNSATLTGAVFPGSESTTWFFQWGNTPAYGQNTAAQKFAPSTTAQLAVVPLQSLLAPGIIYHFRLVASHTSAATTYGSDSTFMTYPSPRPTPTMTASTRPGHQQHGPYVFTTSGHLGLPSWMPPQYACNGNVTFRFFRGLKQVGFTIAGIQPNCTFSGRTVFNTIPGGRRLHPHRAVGLRVVIRSLSNNYLETNRASIEQVKLG